MILAEAKHMLADATDKKTVIIPASLLKKLSLADIPVGVSVKIGMLKDGVRHMEWEGRLYRSGEVIEGEAELLRTRKYWYGPITLEQYMELICLAVETRHRNRGDVELTDYNDDGAYIRVRVAIRPGESNPAKAFDKIKKISDEVEEGAERTLGDVGKHIAEVTARLSGWGSETLDKLVESVETATSADDKGKSLEELASRLFEQIPGFVVTGRIRSATEEIDITIVNDATDPRIRRESALILAECKNWSSKCGKDEFVIFREKIENRKRRCSLGFLISWNGFATTVTKEMLRGSREETLIVPVTGQIIRAAVRSGDVLKEFVSCWEAAVAL
jgi:hypothetical protein